MNNSQQGNPDPSRPDIDAAEKLALEANGRVVSAPKRTETRGL